MTDYEARGVTIRLESEALVLESRARNRQVRDALSRRIPFAALREVVFKQSRMSDSILILVLGNEPLPEKVGMWRAMEDPNALEFKPGKQANAAHELHARLLLVVEANRIHGVDPASVPYDAAPTGEDTLKAINHRNLDPTSLRDDIAEAAQVLLEVSTRVRAILQRLPQHLEDGERVDALTSGASGSALVNYAALLVVTDRRLFVIRELAEVVEDSIPLTDLEGVESADGLLGKLDVRGGGRSLTLRALDRGATPPLVGHLRSIAAQPAPDAADEVINQLEKLAALLDCGALTRQEFDAQKARLFARE